MKGISMKNYCGWLKNDSFNGDEYVEIYKALEHHQFKYIAESQHFKNGWFMYEGRGLFSADYLSNWSRQYEYPYVAANIGKPKARILDVGSGISFFPNYLQSLGHEIVCMDVLDLKKEFQDEGISFIQADITEFESEEQFDIIYSISVLEHIQNKSNALHNIFKLLKPGGRLILTFDCDVLQNVGIDTPNYAEAARMVTELNTLFIKDLSDFDLVRDNLVLTSMFTDTSERWRLPWRVLQPKKQNSISKFFSLLQNMYQEQHRLVIGIFLGVWEKKSA